MEHFVRPPIEVICYTAGLLDGEGSVFKVSSKNRFGFSLSQSIKNNGEDLCLWLREQWGIGGVSPQTKEWPDKPPHIQWHWIVNAAYEVQHGLSAMLPYLRVKRERAELALAHFEERQAAGVRFFWTPGENAYLREHWREHNNDISRVIGRTPAAIARQRTNLGLDLVQRDARIWREAEIQYLKDNWQRYSDSEIGATLGRSAGGVGHQRRLLGFRRG